jgi:hypothetical protein
MVRRRGASRSKICVTQKSGIFLGIWHHRLIIDYYPELVRYGDILCRASGLLGRDMDL